MPTTPLDFALAALYAVVWPLWTALVSWPQMVRALAEGRPGVRVHTYVTTMIEQWGLAALVLWRNHAMHRPLSVLGLRMPGRWPGLAGVIVCAWFAWVMARQVRRVAANPKSRARVRAQVGGLGPLLPTTPLELKLFLALSLTAGFCEELMYRGHLGWLLAPWLTLPGALAVASVMFGIGHSYQGARSAMRIGVVGSVFSVIYLACHSLLPGMVLHALVDMGSGGTVYQALREDAPAEPEPVAT